MYPTDVDFKGRPIDRAWAESRDRNEHLTEIKQIKGASETHPVLSPTDEFANFEMLTLSARRSGSGNFRRFTAAIFVRR